MSFRGIGVDEWCRILLLISHYVQLYIFLAVTVRTIPWLPHISSFILCFNSITRLYLIPVLWHLHWTPSLSRRQHRLYFFSAYLTVCALSLSNTHSWTHEIFVLFIWYPPTSLWVSVRLRSWIYCNYSFLFTICFIFIMPSMFAFMSIYTFIELLWSCFYSLKFFCFL